MIATERLLLRRWRDTDVDAHYRIVQDPAVVRTLGGPPPRDASEQVVARQNGLLDATGSCFWAVEHRASGALVGWCGVKPGPDGTPIAGLSEIGWTLGPPWWGQGYALEAARASLAWAWARLPAPGIVAITTPGNARSRHLMERLGMRRVDGGEFDHPALAADDPLRPHLTYRIERPAPAAPLSPSAICR